VRLFRVDNPHTKPLAFWEWLIAQVKEQDPGVLFLAEAFTRPPMMHTLAKIGFTQSYTYFTWRNDGTGLREYLTDLTTSPTADYMRPNLWPNTPDILHAYLQHGGPPAFKVRAVLAATLSPAWGIYSGFELYEHTAVRPGSEEYLDSEKYQLRPRDFAAAEAAGRSLAPYLTRLNEVRREHPALQRLRGLTFHHSDNPEVFVYSRRTGDDVVLAVVNLDPYRAQETIVRLDVHALGIEPGARMAVHDQLGAGAVYGWGQDNYVRLDPAWEPAHLFVVRPA
jgi:starch synthase (maltosyl-transferring)